MLVGHGAGDLEARGQGRTRRAMRVLLPGGSNDLKHAVTLSSGDAILDVLKKYKTIAVVGLSSNPKRPSFGVTEYMQGAGYRIIPVNPNETEVLGEKSYARLEDVREKIEIVNVFRRAEDVPPVVESAIRIGAKVVWMQSGIENEVAAEKARAAGLVVLEDACILVEHRRRAGKLTP
jgi:predicted CoA-binding protein